MLVQFDTAAIKYDTVTRVGEVIVIDCISVVCGGGGLGGGLSPPNVGAPAL